MVFWIPPASEPASGAVDTGLAVLMCPMGGPALKDEILAFRRVGIDGVVSMLTPAEVADLGLSLEESIVRDAGMKYWSLPIFDHGVPDSIAALAALVDDLRAEMRRGATIGAHCWAGIGRSCLLLSCLLCAEGATPAEAFSRLSRARGFDVPETREQRRWVERFAAAYSEMPR